MKTVEVMVLVVVGLVVCQQTTAFYRNMGRRWGGQRRLPSCSSASKPCRLMAELAENSPEVPASSRLRRVMSSQACSCPRSSPCSSQWDRDHDKVIVRELRTNGNINMTFSMMFCNPVRPALQRWCRGEEVALRLKGMSSVPTEVDSMACTCADRRPLVLHRRYLGTDFLQYDDYVCANHKRRCNVGWNPDNCLVHNPANNTDFYPCKCPQHTVCRSTSDIPFNKNFRCLPVEY